MQKRTVYTAIIKANELANAELFRRQDSVLQKTERDSTRDKPVQISGPKRAAQASKSE
jgi:hypothetical protein